MPNSGATVPTMAMFLAQFATAFPMRILPMLAPLMMASTGIEANAIGYFSTVAAAGAMSSALLSAHLVDRYGSPRTLQIALLVGAVATIFLAQSQPLLLFFGSFMAGLADGPTPSTGNADLQRSASLHLRNTLFSIKMLGGPLGGMAASLLLPAVALHAGWGASAMMAGAVALCVCAVIFLSENYWPVVQQARTSDLGTTAPVAQALRILGQTSYARRLIFAGGVLAISQGAWYAYYMTYLVQELSRSLVFSGAMISIALVSVVIARLFLAWVADISGKGQTIFSLLCLSAGLPWIALAFSTPTTPDVLIMALSVLFGVCQGGWLGLQHAEFARTTSSADIAEVSGTATFVMFAGLAASGALFAGLAHLTGGYHIGFAALSCMTLLLGGYLLSRPQVEPV